MGQFVAIFHVVGVPKAQPRPRAFARRMGGKFVARVFDAGTAEGWKSLVATEARSHRPAAPLEEPLSVELDFFLPRPKSRSRKCDVQDAIACASKPDCDNLAKAVLDCMTQDGWWRDDSQVVRLVVEKRYHAIGARPGASVRVREMQ